MFTETAAAISAAKQAFELIKIIKDARDQSVINSALNQLHEKITDLQMTNAELSSLYLAEKQITMKLTEENTQIKMFALQSKDYEIYTTDAGSTVYRLKTLPDSDIETHYLCTHCFQKREISILQPTGKNIPTTKGRFWENFCPNCSTNILMHKVISVKQNISAFLPR
ncbi:hypothetical protein [Photorhabdus khanii]|uniref:Uncharacterized protein n=1 Tax=Photorhabdus khanii subsp. guanajuatensis TaxID=2100166 RepID=A0A4R4J406_9GAMM|nr:hypothetical protein [Photorhabdus khanii]TDB48254.1 hypothetical protein C5467_19470 [Photorhabdus khanii subsp. guanajuatensis]